MKDIILVFKYVQNIIKSFGGHPNSVTALGESSGATAVYALQVAPSGNGLFHTPLHKVNYTIAAEDNKICIEEGIKECLYNLSKNELLNSITFSSIQTGHLEAATIYQLKMKNMELC